MMNDMYHVPPHLLLKVYSTLGDLFSSEAREVPEPYVEASINDGYRAPVKRLAFLLPSVSRRKAA